MVFLGLTEFDETGGRARQDRRLDRAAGARHQQPAGRVRVREAALGRERRRFF